MEYRWNPLSSETVSLKCSKGGHFVTDRPTDKHTILLNFCRYTRVIGTGENVTWQQTRLTDKPERMTHRVESVYHITRTDTHPPVTQIPCTVHMCLMYTHTILDITNAYPALGTGYPNPQVYTQMILDPCVETGPRGSGILLKSHPFVVYCFFRWPAGNYLQRLRVHTSMW